MRYFRGEIIVAGSYPARESHGRSRETEDRRSSRIAWLERLAREGAFDHHGVLRHDVVDPDTGELHRAADDRERWHEAREMFDKNGRPRLTA